MKKITSRESQYGLQGWSMVEVLTVISLLALVAVVGFINYPKYVDRQNLETTANLIISYTQNAQNDSILAKRALSYGMRYFPNRLETIGISDTEEQILKVVNFSKNLKIENLNNSRTVVFQKLSGEPDIALSLDLNSKYYQLKIEIDKLGKIKRTDAIKT